MKTKYITIVAFLMLLGCDNDFLEKLPADGLVAETTFTNYNNFRTYAWGFYAAFDGYGETSFNNNLRPDSEFNGDLFLNNRTTRDSDWIGQLITIPTNSKNYSDPYVDIRRANLMLDNIEGSELSEIEKLHWQSVGYFFRSMAYFDLVSKYGDIPWIETAIPETSEELQKARTPRNEVTSNILDNLLFAEENIKPDGDGHNSIGIHAVRALISRFGVFEGAWRKYHGLTDAQKYFKASAEASEKLIANFPNLHPNYDEVFNSESLAGKAGIILYNEYLTGVKTHYLTSRLGNSAGNWDLTKKAADMYLMKDGETRWTSATFDGEQDPYDEFRNRDERMYYTITPPFRINWFGGKTGFVLTGDPKDQEYIDLMATLTDEPHKSLPSQAFWGGYVKVSPHFRFFNEGHGYNAGFTGYKLFKFYNKLTPRGIQNRDFSDSPEFRMGEILINHAEAKFELGEFDQAIADLTINKLRIRGKVAPLTVGVEPNDPTRDPAITPTLWEIRRERAIELMGEGFRFDDLRRWKKMDYTDAEKLGRWVKNSDYNNRLPIQAGSDEGFISPFDPPSGGFPDHYYLYPIPSNQIVLTNGIVVQNPGWQ